MKKEKVWWIVAAATIAVALSAAFVKITVTDASYVGVIVALLGIMVTFAVGYQIYNNIDMRESTREFKRLKAELGKTQEELNESRKELKAEIGAAMRELYVFKAQAENTKGMGMRRDKQYLLSICHYLIGIFYAFRGNDEKLINIIISNSRNSLRAWGKNPPENPLKCNYKINKKHPKEVCQLYMKLIDNKFGSTELYKKVEPELSEIKRRLEEKIAAHEATQAVED